MCDLIYKCDEEEVTGYKVAVKIDDKYFSPATGLEYKVGPIPLQFKYQKHVADFVNVLDENNECYNTNMTGRTCVFRDLESAKHKQNKWYSFYELIILKMTISNDLLSGYYSTSEVYGGKNIVSMEELNES